MGLAEWWRTEARRLKREVYALYLACRDPRVPWYAKAVAAVVVALRLQPHRPDPGLTDCRLRAEAAVSRGKPVSRARPSS